MPWTYLNFNVEGDYMPGEKQKLPQDNCAYLGFDLLRWSVVLGYTEGGGYSSMLNPHVSDNCTIVAFAPLSETTEPDESQILDACPFVERNDYPAYKPDANKVTLLRENKIENSSPNVLPLATQPIEVGKPYKTRCGLDARVYATDAESAGHAIHGAIFNEPLGWHRHTWCQDGRAHSSDDYHPLDLMDAEEMQSNSETAIMPRSKMEIHRETQTIVQELTEKEKDRAYLQATADMRDALIKRNIEKLMGFLAVAKDHSRSQYGKEANRDLYAAILRHPVGQEVIKQIQQAPPRHRATEL